MILRILKYTGLFVAYLIGFLLLVFTLKYITCPVFDFEKEEPFSGDEIYNPYTGIENHKWWKGNFQVQSYAWAGITAGRRNSNDEIYDVYKKLGYDIIATSDYQRINRYHEGKPGYIPVYEHGYGIQKSHQVLIGAKQVLWKDYPFFQTIHNKQHIINKLREDNELIFLAHPKLRNGYSVEDMTILTGYTGIEVLNNFRTSTEHWDAALSAGNYVTILGNDDAHDVSNPDEIGHHCTLISAPSIQQEDIIHALKLGSAIGVKAWRPLGETMEDKVKRIGRLPRLLRAEIKNDTFYISTDSLIKETRFIGQEGQIRKIDKSARSPFITFSAQDKYIRTEIEFANRITFYLNPVCRYDGSAPATLPEPVVDHYRTRLLRIIGFATLIFIGINVILLKKRFRKRKQAE